MLWIIGRYISTADELESQVVLILGESSSKGHDAEENGKPDGRCFCWVSPKLVIFLDESWSMDDC